MKPLLALLLVLADDAQPADLVIRIDHIDNNAGQVLVALYDNAGSFPKLPLKNAVAPAQAGRTSVTFKDLPAGDYAFSVVHDVNGNDKVDRNLFGIPTEKYAFTTMHWVEWDRPALPTLASACRRPARRVQLH